MKAILETIQNYDKVTANTNQLVINNITYKVAASGENARTQETMRELTEVVVAASKSIGSTNESQMAVKLQKAINDFVNVFEIVGIE